MPSCTNKRLRNNNYTCPIPAFSKKAGIGYKNIPMKVSLLKTILLIVTTCSFFVNKAQTGFDKIYSFNPYPNFSVFSCIRTILPDTQRIVVAGETSRDTTDFSPFTGVATFLASFDYSGNVQWKKLLVFNPPLYKANDALSTHLLAKVRAGKYVFAAQGWDITNVPNWAIPRPYLYFFKSNGDSLKFVPMPIFNVEECTDVLSIVIDKRYNIIVTGRYWNKANADTAGIWLSKFDSAGNFKWRKVIVDTPLLATGAMANKVIEGNENSYLFAGLGATLDTIHSSLYAIWKTDTAGYVLWRKQIPRIPDWPNNEFYDANQFDIIKASNNSGYYFIALKPKTVLYPGEPPSTRTIYYCGKFNENGNLIWAKTYDRDSLHFEQSIGIEQKANGDLLFMGTSVGLLGQTNTASSGAALFSTDSLGNLKWFKVNRHINCPYNVGHIMQSMKVAPNGNIVRGGYIFQFNKQPGCYDTADAIGWLVMTDSLGRKNTADTITYPVLTDTIYVPLDTTTHPIGNAIRLIPDEEKPFIALYPNPVTDVVHIALHNFNGFPALVSMQVMDYTGRMVMQKKMAAMEDVMDLSAYTSGIYLIKLRYKDKDIGVQKVVRK
jgi:hypothetical protein